MGRGAEVLTLNGREIGHKDKELQNLFLGMTPDGERLRYVSLKERRYVSEKTGEMMTSLPNLGWDFTFSAPKSVSVLWSQGDPDLREKIEACHRRAVEKAAEHLESCVYVRSGKGGEVREEGRAILAAFTHTMSKP